LVDRRVDLVGGGTSMDVRNETGARSDTAWVDTRH
jgi:hypothetical protein